MMTSFIPKLKLLVLPCLFWLATPEDCHQLDEVGFEPIQKSFRSSQLSKKDRSSYLRNFRNMWNMFRYPIYEYEYVLYIP